MDKEVEVIGNCLKQIEQLESAPACIRVANYLSDYCKCRAQKLKNDAKNILETPKEK